MENDKNKKRAANWGSIKAHPFSNKVGMLLDNITSLTEKSQYEKSKRDIRRTK